VVGRIRRFPRFLVPVTTSPERAPCAMDRHVHRGSAPRVSHPLGGFLASPGFAAFDQLVSEPTYMPLPCRTSTSLQGSTRRNRAPLPGPLAPSSFGLAPRSSATCRALISLDFPRRPRPSDPPAPEAPSVTSCVLECGRPRRGGRSPSRARATFPPENHTLQCRPQIPRHPQARQTVLTLASLRRPRSVLPPACPTPFPGVATGSWVVALVGFSPPERCSGSGLGP
jgi:hypothetical protein